MVPLPDQRELTGIKLIRIPHIILPVRTQVDLEFLDRHGLVSQDRPAVRPGDGLQGRDPPHGTVVLEHHRIPVPFLGLHDGPLRHAVPTAVEFSLQDGLRLVRTEHFPAAPAGLRTGAAGRPVDHQDIIPVADVIDVGSFGTQAVSFPRTGEQHLVHAPFLHAGQIRLQFRDTDFTVAPDHIDAAVFEEKRGVMEGLADNLARPLFPDPRCRIDIGLALVVGDE